MPTEMQELREAIYYAELGSPTKGKEAVEQAVAQARADERERICKEIEEHLGKPEHHYHLPAGEFYLISKRDWQALKSGQEVKK